jgi:flagellar basal body-associated protein FliL
MISQTTAGVRARKESGNGFAMSALSFVAIVVLAVAGWYWHSSTSAQSSDALGSSAEVKAVQHLDGFVVNLSGASGNGYLRVGIDLGLGVELKAGEAQSAAVARVRDTILSVLGSRSVEELLSAAGRAKLKDDLLNAIRERVPEIQCQEVYFTEFLVQH